MHDNDSVQALCKLTSWMHCLSCLELHSDCVVLIYISNNCFDAFKNFELLYFTVKEILCPTAAKFAVLEEETKRTLLLQTTID